MMPVRHRTFFPPSPLFCGGPECFRGTTKEPQAARLPLQRLAQWEVVSSYSSATAPDSHGISCAESTFPSSQRTDTRTSGLRPPLQEFFISWRRIADPKVRSNHRLPLFLPALRKLEGSRRVSHSERSRWRCTENNTARSL